MILEVSKPVNKGYGEIHSKAIKFFIMESTLVMVPSFSLKGLKENSGNLLSLFNDNL